MRRTASISASITAAVAMAAGLSLAIPAAGATASSSAPPVMTIAMNGKKISVGGTLESGGVRIVSTVSGVAQAEPTLVRLDPGVSLAAFFAALKKASGDPNNLDGIASIVVDAAANRGTSSIQASLLPGIYVALDTTASNPAKWPLTTFTLARSAHPASLPAPRATMAAIEFGFRGPGRLHDGELVRFVNRGFLVHMIVYLTARNAADARQIATLLHQGKAGRASRLATGFGTFAGPLSHAGGQQFTVRSKPGYYVLACFMSTQDGRDHTQLGMERVIRIVK